MEIITGVERRRRWTLRRSSGSWRRLSSLVQALPRLPGDMRSAVACCGTGEARCAAVCSGRNRRRCSCRWDDQRSCRLQRCEACRPMATAGAAVSSGNIEITLPDGTSVKVGHDVGLATLRRVMSVLRR